MSVKRSNNKKGTQKKTAKIKPAATSQKNPVKKQAERKKKHSPNIKSFPVVGIGGSAGGLEAFSEFLQHLSPTLGMAYVYIQHLSPDHESFLSQILQRKTKMPVLEVKDGIQLKKNQVYVIPSKYNVSVTDGKLKLQKKTKGDSIHSIDYFLSSLAPLYQQNAIGVVLSGTGSDGTLGLMAIKSEGGITFAQDDTANYHGMPHHAVEMGYVDFVMPPDKIAA